MRFDDKNKFKNILSMIGLHVFISFSYLLLTQNIYMFGISDKADNLIWSTI